MRTWKIVEDFMHQASIEQLWHFNCTDCKNWWTIGDFKPKADWVLVCPHCGKEDEVEVISSGGRL